MRITQLATSGTIYTCNCYYVTGTWNTLRDRNSIIDPGCDPSVFESLEAAHTGVGQRKVEQVILTHGHYDHVSLLGEFKRRYNAKVYAASPAIEGVDQCLTHGDRLLLGDREFEVLVTPGHSSDSLCFYNDEEGVLFSGDTPLVINGCDGTYEPGFLEALEEISRRNVRAIYFGHGAALLSGCVERVKETVRNVRAAQAQGTPGRS